MAGLSGRNLMLSFKITAIWQQTHVLRPRRTERLLTRATRLAEIEMFHGTQTNPERADVQHDSQHEEFKQRPFKSGSDGHWQASHNATA